MIQTTNIGSSRDALYAPVRRLYESSFPLHEQRTPEQQDAAFDSRDYRLTAYTGVDGCLLGFIGSWRLGGCTYIEHFAVAAELRGHGYGGRILRQFTDGEQTAVVLEIDPVTDATSAARLRFYERCGFVANAFSHIHPAYRPEFAGHPLVVLSHREPMTQEAYTDFYRCLCRTVMRMP